MEVGGFMHQTSTAKKVFSFLLFLGFISLLSDFTHEGARSIYGQYLGVIGISAFTISFIAGLGEFFGQSLRIFTGMIADKTKKYWTMMIIGYSINLLSIPLLSLVDGSIWQVALVLILLERIGKAIRAPAKSALTSFTSPQLGAGKAFAIQEALDQLGAFLGPIFIFTILSFNGGASLSSYQIAFGYLGIFAILTIVLLIIAKTKYPKPDEFESSKIGLKMEKNTTFIYYMIAISFLALGFIDYPLLAYHMDVHHTIAPIYLPLLYSVAMGIDAIAALFFGHIFDKIGIRSLLIAIGISMFFSPFIFLFDSTFTTIIGILLWGIGMGAQESILKSVIALIVPKEKRATYYGIFNSVFGLLWFAGSSIIGVIYGYSSYGVVIFSLSMEILCLIFLIIFNKKIRKSNPLV